jgi:hypothetical protein
MTNYILSIRRDRHGRNATGIFSFDAMNELLLLRFNTVHDNVMTAWIQEHVLFCEGNVVFDAAFQAIHVPMDEHG